MSDQPAPTRLEPVESAGGAPFWEASRELRFEVPWCRACGRPHWFPRVACPHCLSDDLEWRPAAGTGVVHAVSVMPKPGNPLMAGRDPYAVALVDLPEGVRVMGEVVTGSPEEVAVGDAVNLGWEPLTDGRNLPVWHPAPEA